MGKSPQPPVERTVADGPQPDGVAAVDYLTVERVGDRSLAVAGELDMASEATLRSALEEILASDGPVELDMAAVTFLDSTGTRAVIDAAVALHDRGGLTVASPSPSVVRVFELFGLLPENPAIPLNVRWDGSRPHGGPGAVRRFDAVINRTVEAQMHARASTAAARRLVTANQRRRAAAAEGGR